jgi:hypothetical protein
VTMPNKDEHTERRIAQLREKREQFASDPDKLSAIDAKIAQAQEKQARQAEKAQLVAVKPEKTKRAEAKANKGTRSRGKK